MVRESTQSGRRFLRLCSPGLKKDDAVARTPILKGKQLQRAF